jgi:MinD superfamily P-loop ATPase
VVYVDCDVEEPNGHIFLKPQIAEHRDVTVPVPQVDLSKCIFCGECSAVCEFHAIAVLGDTVEVFPTLCHGCGSCRHICPCDAIKEIPRVIGQIRSGTGHGVTFYEGRLNVGEAIAPPVTRALKKLCPPSMVIIIDAPPGTSCPVIEAIHDTDFVILVTEPTPFGLYDLELAVGVVRELGIPHGVVLNRSDIGDNRVEQYCRDCGIDILMSIPHDRRIAERYSRGEMIDHVDSKYEQRLCNLGKQIRTRVNGDRTRSRQR